MIMLSRYQKPCEFVVVVVVVVQGIAEYDKGDRKQFEYG